MRVQQLEEQLRQLNGRVEEMSFQLLQMQEQLRKAQEDNEFRFQELEGGGKKKSSIEVVPGAGDVNTANASGAQSPEQTKRSIPPTSSRWTAVSAKIPLLARRPLRWARSSSTRTAIR